MLSRLGADLTLRMHGAGDADDTFTLADPAAAPEAAVVKAVAAPTLFCYLPEHGNGRAMLVLGGGGYVELMAGREGVQVARWLNRLGYVAYVLVHRFPTAEHGPSAPLDDARAAMAAIRASGSAAKGLGVVGLSSGGHLAACLAAEYPAEWAADGVGAQVMRPDALVIGYAPISTNAAGRQIVADKPPLPPVEKQAMYDRLQPDAQLLDGPPPAFIVYAGNDPVVPVENARRLHAAFGAKGGSAELHIFGDAPHGFALDTLGQPVSVWPTLCEAWLRQIGFLDATTAA